MDASDRVSAGKQAMTPLWIVALFLSLTETFLSFAVIQTAGRIQEALTAFVICFPLLVAGSFFYILWNKPYVLYAPTEYGKGTDVGSFVEAMQSRHFGRDHLYEVLQKTIQDTLASEDFINDLTEAVSHEKGGKVREIIGPILNDNVSKAIEKIKEVAFLTIDSRPVLGDEGHVWQVPYNKYRTISDFLDDIWASVAVFPPYSFGVIWALSDPKNRRLFKEMGRTWAFEHNMEKDTRRLEDGGIVPGMTLEVVFKPVK